MRETYGSTILDFAYNADGSLYSFRVNGTYYYYVTNLQGDVIGIVDANGNTVASYEYDPYGDLVSATGDMAAINPMRYRGYYYDAESTLYYLQSRYYDPELGRFINADTLVSTGQGLLGNNMYAYCQNDPIDFYDPTGHAYKGINNQINYSEYEHTYGGHRENGILPPQEFYFSIKVLEPYNGVSVIEVPFLNDKAMSIGVIFIGDEVSSDKRLIRHEFGHIIQLREIGLMKYLNFIAVPSVTYMALNELGFSSYGSYYDTKWECLADMLGGVRRNHAPGAEIKATEYWLFVISYEYPDIPLS